MKNARLQPSRDAVLSVFSSRIVRGRYEGSFIDGSRDSKYDLHRHVLLQPQLGDGNDHDPNWLCIFIFILDDCWCGIFYCVLRFPTYTPLILVMVAIFFVLAN